MLRLISVQCSSGSLWTSVSACLHHICRRPLSSMSFESPSHLHRLRIDSTFFTMSTAIITIFFSSYQHHISLATFRNLASEISESSHHIIISTHCWMSLLEEPLPTLTSGLAPTLLSSLLFSLLNTHLTFFDLRLRGPCYRCAFVTGYWMPIDTNTFLIFSCHRHGNEPYVHRILRSHYQSIDSFDTIPTSDSENFRETDDVLYFHQTFGHNKDVRTGVNDTSAVTVSTAKSKQRSKDGIDFFTPRKTTLISRHDIVSEPVSAHYLLYIMGKH